MRGTALRAFNGRGARRVAWEWLALFAVAVGFAAAWIMFDRWLDVVR